MKRKIVAIILIIISLLMVMIPSFAASTKELNNQKRETQSKVEEAKKQNNKLKAEKDQTINEISNLEDDISDYEEQLSTLNIKITNLEKDIEKKGNEIEKLEKEYEEMQELLTEKLVAIYEQGPVTFIDVLLSSDNFMDLVTLPIRVKELAEADDAQMEKVENQRKVVEKTKRELENNKQELDSAKKSAEAKRKQLNLVKKSKESKVANLTEEQKKIQKNIEDYNNEIKKLDREIAKAEEEARKHFNGNIGSGSGVLAWPLPYKARITSPFGKREQPVAGASTYHRGIDIGVPTGTSVLAAADGYVMSQGYNKYRGYYVMVKHADNLYTFYQHLSSINVPNGRYVKKGQKIANSGSSGIGTGPHLHFEVRTGPYYGSEVDPMKYL